MAKLILVRHGESEWNAQGLWTGWIDIGLSEKGKKEAGIIAKAIKDIQIDLCFTSTLLRAKQTLQIILDTLGYNNLPIIESKALNERDYGIYTGKNKWEVKKELGEEEFLKLRRSWDYPIPQGESLKDVAARVMPFYKSDIEPKLLQEKNILIAAHGNSIRALIKEIENIPDANIAYIEIATGEAIVYTFDKDGLIANKEHLKVK